MAVDEPIEILDESPGTGPRPARRARALIAVLALLGLLVTGLMVRSAEPDVDVAVDDETEPEERAAERDGMAPTPLALGAPDDGKDSVGLPVSAEPSTGLLDGQAVTVTGSGFPPGESVGVVMCAREAGRDHGARGAEACDIGRYAPGSVGPDGVVVTTFHVQRTLLLDGQEIDCASEQGRCLIGMGLISDYDRSGGVLVDFDPAAPLAEPPTVSLARADGIVDGETIAATVTGLRPGSTLFVQQCETATQRCVPIGDHPIGDDGAFDGSVRLWRSFGAWTEPGTEQSPNVDCAAVPCHLVFDGAASRSRPLPVVDLTFDGSRGARTPPTVRLARAGPFAPGDWLDVEVEGATPGAHADAVVCARDGSWCSGSSTAQIGASGTVRLTPWIENGAGSRRCGGTCVLTVNLFSDGPPTGGPPPLFPPPILVEVRD